MSDIGFRKNSLISSLEMKISTHSPCIEQIIICEYTNIHRLCKIQLFNLWTLDVSCFTEKSLCERALQASGFISDYTFGSHTLDHYWFQTRLMPHCFCLYLNSDLRWAQNFPFQQMNVTSAQ